MQVLYEELNGKQPRAPVFLLAWSNALQKSEAPLRTGLVVMGILLFGSEMSGLALRMFVCGLCGSVAGCADCESELGQDSVRKALPRFKPSTTQKLTHTPLAPSPDGMQRRTKGM